MSWEPVIGIEVHAQLKTNTKLFCACETAFGTAVNANVCPVCLALPGALPVLNKRAVELAIQAGFALNCDLNPVSVFARKNYFYPDLPKGYQISQFDAPICTKGRVEIALESGSKEIGITRIHIEEDAGKLLHQGADAIKGATHSLVDLNRACTPLIEIVSEPDIASAEEARAYVEQLRMVLRHLGICDGNLEEGSMRADINLSVRRRGEIKFGTRTEVKNVNSFRSIENAVRVEMARQIAVLESGGTIIQQTRNYDDASQSTTPLRDKEESHDYRYFPDPDLIPLKLSPAFIERVKSEMAELPDTKKSRYLDDYGLSAFEVKVILQDVAMDAYFREAVALYKDGSIKHLAKWLVGDVTAMIKEKGSDFESALLSPSYFVELLSLIDSGKISGKMAKDILKKAIDTGKSPKTLVDKSGMTQISDSGELGKVVAGILAQNMDVVEKVKNGKTKSADFLMGQVMKETRGRAKPDLVRDLILSQIDKL